MRFLRELPETLYAADTEGLFDELFPIFTVSASNSRSFSVSAGEAQRLDNTSSYTVRLFDLIPVKTLSVRQRESISLIPGGESLGISIYTKGLLVVGLGDFTDRDGRQVCPAKEAGIRAGDIIISVEGRRISDTGAFSEALQSAGEAMALEVLRGDARLQFTVSPALSSANNDRLLGLWVRESTAGIGTLSFYAPESGRYGALGHPITDVDLGVILDVGHGSIVRSKILGVSAGSQGLPGEIHGVFSGEVLGSLERNTAFGIYGQMGEEYKNPLYPQGVTLGYPDEAVLGDAEILTTIDESGVRRFRCKVIQVNPQTEAGSKGLVIEITDETLLEATGGIVQGMSGSPLIQNGKLIGIVTHVFVNDPTKGYCIHALWMYNAA